MRVLSHFSPFYTVPLHMSPKRTWVRACIVALVAFVWLFSTVRFQMCPQMACTRRGIVTLVAFVRLFFTVSYQMSPQITYLRESIVTLVAFVWFFSTVRFQMYPQMAWIRRCIVTLVTFWFNDIASCFLQDCHICTLQTKVIIFKILLHCHCVFCFAQMVASNWVKFFIDFWSPIIAFV